MIPFQFTAELHQRQFSWGGTGWLR